MSLAYMGAPSRTAPCRGPELVSYRRDPAPQIGVFYTNFGNMHCPAASTGRAPDHRDRCWVRLLLCAKVLTESDQALGREGRIADPHRQEPDVIGNPTTPQIGGFYANFRSMRRQAASTGRAPDHRDSLLGTSSLVCESSDRIGGINREGPRSQGPLLGTSSLVCESSDRIGPGTRPGGANRGPPSPRARCNWKSYNNPKGSGPALSTPGWESSTTAAEAADVGGQVIKEKYPSPIRNFSSLVKRHLHPILL